MDLLPEAIEDYIAAHTSQEEELLRELSRETHLKVPMPRMLSGHVQGVFLQLLSAMIRPRHILEIGTFTGYSALCLAKGLTEDGVLTTIDVNEELEEMVQRYIRKAGLQDRIKQLVGDAHILIPSLSETFDLVFIDADKTSYADYFDLVIDKVRPGGFIVADNVLWSGKVVAEKKDKDTRAIDAYNQKVAADPRVKKLILPLRDGLNIAQKFF